MNYLPLFSSDFNAESNEVEIIGARARELINLHQLVIGLELRALVYNQSIGLARILEVSKDKLRLTYSTGQLSFTKNPISLMVGLSRPQTIKKVLAATMAFGVGAVEFVQSETSEGSYAQSNIWKKENLEQELSLAMAQTGDPIAPKVALVKSLSASNFITNDYDCFLADLQPEIIAPKISSGSQPKLLAVGPEKGWSDREKEYFQSKGFKIISFGSRILRVEQAVLAGLGQLVVE